MQDNSQKYWNDEYWEYVINNNKADFIKESFMGICIEKIIELNIRER